MLDEKERKEQEEKERLRREKEARKINHTIILPLYQSRQEFDYAMNIIMSKK